MDAAPVTPGGNPARAYGIDTAAAEIGLADAIARPWTYERDPRGSLGLLADRDRRILVGAWAVAPLASEWIRQAALAIRARIPVDVLLDQVAQSPPTARRTSPRWSSSPCENIPARAPAGRVTTTRVTPAWLIRPASAGASWLGRIVDAEPHHRPCPGLPPRRSPGDGIHDSRPG